MILIHDDLLARLIELEADVRYQEYAAAGEAEFLYQAGTLPVLISAPHGAAHTRNGRIKEEDEYTAGLARLIAGITGAHVIYARRKSSTDPNVDAAAPYKQAVQAIMRQNHVTFVLDLHGAHQGRDFGVALGTMHGKSCTEHDMGLMVSVFEKYGISAAGENLFRLDIDRQLPGEGSDGRETMIKFCRRHAWPAAQVEVNAWLRVPARRADATQADKDFRGDPRLIRVFINALSEGVLALAGR